MQFHCSNVKVHFNFLKWKLKIQFSFGNASKYQIEKTDSTEPSLLAIDTNEDDAIVFQVKSIN